MARRGVRFCFIPFDKGIRELQIHGELTIVWGELSGSFVVRDGAAKLITLQARIAEVSVEQCIVNAGIDEQLVFLSG